MVMPGLNLNLWNIVNVNIFKEFLSREADKDHRFRVKIYAAENRAEISANICDL